MKIATWNIERPFRNGLKTPKILNYLHRINADILVLTETNVFIELGNEYTSFHSAMPKENYYREGERRVSIFSKYPIIRNIKTFREDTSVCTTVKTPFGELAVYGTIIGLTGNKDKNFERDLEQQLLDIETKSLTSNICLIGDLNISFSDIYYYTKAGRKALNDSFANLGLKILTEQIRDNMDHIVLTNKFIEKSNAILSFWNDTENIQERLSDHKGVMVEIF